MSLLAPLSTADININTVTLSSPLLVLQSSFFVPKLKGLFRHNTKRRSTSRASGLLQFGGEEEEEEDDDDIEMNLEPLIHGQACGMIILLYGISSSPHSVHMPMIPGLRCLC